MPSFEFRLIHLYFLVSLVFFARLTLAWVRTRRLFRASIPGPSGARVSDRITVPVAVGCLRPRVILPANWTGWDSETLDAALTHEQAHARRRDPLITLLVAVNKAVFWFHPLAWWIERRLAALAEEAADEECLMRLGDRQRYAAILLDMARSASVNRGRLAVAMARSANITRRIDRILSWSETRPWTRRRAIALVAVALPLALAAAAFQAVPAQSPATEASQSTEPGEIVTVEGKVLDSTTNQPIEGARVGLLRDDRGMAIMAPMWDEADEDDPAAQRQKTVTSSNGIFRFRIQSPAQFQLFIECEGYLDGQAGNFRRLKVERGQSKDDIVIQLKPEGALSGRVIDIETRKPLANLTVVAHGYSEILGNVVRLCRRDIASQPTMRAGT